MVCLLEVGFSKRTGAGLVPNFCKFKNRFYSVTYEKLAIRLLARFARPGWFAACKMPRRFACQVNAWLPCAYNGALFQE
jgi:hypothetical protein